MMRQQKVMLVNWAPIWEGARVGGGVNLYCQQIGLELVRRGFQVHYVFSGFTYNFVPFSYIRAHKPWQGMHLFEIVNSPCLAPGRNNSGYPQTELTNHRILKLFQRILDTVQPDIIHFNNIEGFSSDCVAMARQHGARVIFSLHNYHTVCPQVALLFKDHDICEDYQDGHYCTNCLPHQLYWVQRSKRAISKVLAATGNLDKCKSFFRAFRGRCKEVRQSFTKHVYNANTNESSTMYPGPAKSAHSPASYKLRRQGMIAALNEAHVVLAVSHFVAQKFIQLGVQPDLVKVNHIGSNIGKLVEEYRKTHPAKPHRYPTLPLKFVFIGQASNYKGLPVLLEAFEKIPHQKRAHCRLFIYAQYIEDLLERVAALRPTLSELHVQNGYEFNHLPLMLEDKDIGIVPPIWWDPAPQVVMELLANNIPVIGANTGGIPDFIQDKINGLLFQPGNAEDLANKICYVLDNVEVVKQWHSHINPIKTIERHVDELKTFYDGA